MKTFPLLFAVAAMLALAVNLHSQAPAPKSPVEQLTALKAKNVQLIEKQQAALLKLDEMDKQADQMRILGKRG
jgi:hypothetical protein